MRQRSFFEHEFVRDYGRDGVVARRTWDLVPAPRSVLLKGLFGFPWPERDVHAKCTQRDYAGTTGIFGSVRVDRHHPAVPAVGCSCGIYATSQPARPWVMRRYLAGRILVHGFVRLHGRILFDGVRYRAERARIEGPLVIAVPGPGRVARLLGGRSSAASVGVDGERYRVRYPPVPGSGMPRDDWHEMVADRLTLRYGVAVEPPARPVPIVAG